MFFIVVVPSACRFLKKRQLTALIEKISLRELRTWSSSASAPKREYFYWELHERESLQAVKKKAKRKAPER